MRTIRLLACFVALFCVTSAHAAEIALAGPIRTIRAVGAKGEGNAAAANAWQTIVKRADPGDLIDLLKSMNGANDLATNWFRSAVEASTDAALKAGKKLPVNDLRAFLLDRDNDPRPRRLAYELIARVDGKQAASLIDGFLDDPSVELRRDAVARVLKQADGAIKKEDKIGKFRTALNAARDVDQIDHAAEQLRELGQQVDLARHFGFILRWSLIAPFNNADGVGFAAVYAPEKKVDLRSAFEGKDGKPAKWVKFVSDDAYGMVDFNKPFGELKGVVGYAFTEFHSDKAREAEIRLGCKNAWKLWVNGKEVWAREEYHRGMRIDQYRLKVNLKKGKNTILFKACQDERTYSWTKQWQVQLRVCDATGTAILSTDRPSQVASR